MKESITALTLKDALQEFARAHRDASRILAERTGRQVTVTGRWIKGTRNPMSFDRIIILFTLEKYDYFLKEIDVLPEEFRVFGRMLATAGDIKKASVFGKAVLQIKPYRVSELFKYPSKIRKHHCILIRKHVERMRQVSKSPEEATETTVSTSPRDTAVSLTAGGMEKWKVAISNAFLYSLGSVQQLGEIITSDSFTETDRTEIREMSVKSEISIFRISDMIRALLSQEALERFQKLQQPTK